MSDKALTKQQPIAVEVNPMNLIQYAIDKGSSMENLERLMALKERYDAQMAEKAFLQALADFQHEVPAIEKTKLVSFTSAKTGYKTNYKYAQLGEIINSIKDLLHKHGLTYRWEVKDLDNKIIVTCLISHVDGHTKCSTMESMKDESGGKNDIQSRGSAVTYLQRYTLSASLGLATIDEDNDGRTANPFPEEKTTVKRVSAPPKPTPKEEVKTSNVANLDAVKKAIENGNTWNGKCYNNKIYIANKEYPLSNLDQELFKEWYDKRKIKVVAEDTNEPDLPF